MLRRLVGDEVFFKGLRRFYVESRFTKVGTDDLRQAMEAECGQPLDRFFERWIYGSTLPRITFSYRIESGGGGRSGQQLALHFEQTGDIFDLPVIAHARLFRPQAGEHRGARHRQESSTGACRSKARFAASTSIATTARWRKSSQELRNSDRELSTGV